MSRGRSLEHDVYVRPKPELVAALIDQGYGVDAARERWPWVTDRTLFDLAAEGRRTLGLARPARGVKASSAARDHDDAVVAAVERLASVPAAAAEIGLSQDIVRRVLRRRGIPAPRVDRKAAAVRAAEERRRRAA